MQKKSSKKTSQQTKKRDVPATLRARALAIINGPYDQDTRSSIKFQLKTTDWQVLKDDRWYTKPRPTGGRGTVAAEKALIAEFVNRWLEIGDVRPYLAWKDPAPLLDLAGGTGLFGLFGALAVPLLELAGRCVIVGCTGCRKFFNATPAPGEEGKRQRRPKSGQGRYCKVCQDAGVDVALAKHRKALGISKPRKR